MEKSSLIITQKKLEDEIIEIAKDAVMVTGQPLKTPEIVACHRVGKNGKVICRVINRKYAREFIINGKNLKNKR